MTFDRLKEKRAKISWRQSFAEKNLKGMIQLIDQVRLEDRYLKKKKIKIAANILFVRAAYSLH